MGTEVQDEEMEETVDAEKEKSGAVSWKAFSDGEKLVETEEEPVDKVPNFVKCRVCSGVYKRAVKLPCCGYRACRACAVKHATKLKKCWNKKCGKPLATSDLENDEEQREKVTKWMERKAKWEEGLKGGDLLKCSVCEEICKRAVSMSCSGKAACRACAVKKLTGNSQFCFIVIRYAPNLRIIYYKGKHTIEVYSLYRIFQRKESAGSRAVQPLEKVRTSWKMMTLFEKPLSILRSTEKWICHMQRRSLLSGKS